MDDLYIEDEIKLDRSIMGSFGNFKTNNSFEILYMMTSLNISKLDRLKEASSVLNFNTIDFDAMVQRDIDYVRVDNIFNQYLDKPAEKAVFFPPLLVTLMIIDNGEPIDKYNNIDDELINRDKRNFLERLWDKKIKLTLPLSEHDLDSKIDVLVGEEGNKHIETKNYIHYAGKIEYNDDAVKLVVIDGQHRLKALQKLYDKYPDINTINVPICIFFSSKAKVENTENITQDMRELFVTINNTAKKVSGHFITLLKDNSLSSLAVREFANKLKGSDSNLYNSKLLYLEWNQREDGRAFQVTRKYTITTVSIIAEALKQFVFDDKNGLTQHILGLKEEQEALAIGIGYQDISENEFSLNQIDILKKQINKYIVPSLEILFLESLPYKTIIDSIDLSLEQLNQKITDGITGAKDYKENVLFEFRSLNKFDNDTRATFDLEFNRSIEYDLFFDYFRNNIFQQGYIIAWFSLYEKLELNPISIARALSKSMEKICFNKDISYFFAEREYTQGVLYKGHRMIVNVATKEYISYLILASFSNEDVRKIFLSHIDEIDGVDAKLIDIASQSLEKYLEAYMTKNINILKSNYMYTGYLSEDEKKNLSELDMKANVGTKEDKLKFKEELTRLVNKDKEIAISTLSNILKHEIA